MSYNGSGTFLINTAGQPVVSGTVISSTAFNALTADLATGLSTAITKDGQTTVTANIPMSTYKFTGLGVGSAATDSANLSQVQSTVTKLLNSVSGADAITATASPTLAAYAAGQMFYFVAAGDNTTSVTLNIDSLGAKAVTRDGATALAASDIKSGEVVVVVYDGTRFQVVSQLNSAGDARFANVSIASSLYVGGVSTFVGNAGFSANVSIASALSVGGVAAITGATTIGGNLTLSGGTANGVLYLNGSKVATSGSALVFDGTNLGIGTTSPSRRLEVASSTAALMRITSSVGGQTGYAATEFYNAAGFGYVGTESSVAGTLFVGTTAYATILGNTAAYPIQFATNNNVRATIDSSGNLGIGTAIPSSYLSGTAKLVAYANANSQNSILVRNDSNGASSSSALVLNASGNTWGIEIGSSAKNSNALTFQLDYGGANSTLMTLNTSGNLGLGVTPSAWASGQPAIQIGSTGVQNRSTTISQFSTNQFWNGANHIYINSAAATLYTQNAGVHSWSYAPSGTAGNAISFTQAMTLDASGNLLLGTTSTSPSSNVGVKIYPDGRVYGVSASSANTSESYGMYSTGAAAYRFYVGWGGTVYATNTTISAISDRRLKENIRDLDVGLDAIMALKPRKFDWKEGKGKDIKNDRGFIAQEFEQVFPNLIDTWKDPAPEGEEPYKAVRQDLIPVLVKAIQELKAELDALKGAK